MARQDTQTQSNEQHREQGQEMTRGSQQQRGMSRRGGYDPFGFGIAPADLWRMGPFSLMRRMNQEMSRIFGDFETERGGQTRGGWTPAIEVTEREGKYQVRAELPGLKPDDVSVSVTDDAVVLEGERKFEHEENRGGVHVSERSYGRFYRAIPLPEGAKGDQANARFENGVLEIDVPIEQQQSRQRRIPIQQSQNAQGSQGTQTSGTSGSGSNRGA